MTKEEYNQNLERYHKAMEYYDSNPPRKDQEQFYGNFLNLLETLRQGCNELKPKGKEILEGFDLDNPEGEQLSMNNQGR